MQPTMNQLQRLAASNWLCGMWRGDSLFRTHRFTIEKEHRTLVLDDGWSTSLLFRLAIWKKWFEMRIGVVMILGPKPTLSVF